MRGAAAVLICAAGAVSGTGCGSESRAHGDRWGTTWVLDSPAEVAVPGPPGDTQAVEEPLAPPEDPAVKMWLDEVMQLVARRPKDPVTASRNYALVAVAMQDAALAATHWQHEHGVDGYPSTRAAIAGAGSRVIAYAYPEHPRAQLDRDAEAAASGAGHPRSARAGLLLGREVAERVVARARRDGSASERRVERPRVEGAWEPPPGSSARPVEPGGGTWRTWVLGAGDELRPPPPPAFDSPEFRHQAQVVLDTDRTLTPAQRRIARFWEGGEGTELPPGRWLKVTLAHLEHQPPTSETRVAEIFALLTVAMADAGVAAWDAKYAYWVTRPVNAIRDLSLERDWEPYLDTPFFPAYVSGHAAYSGAAAEVLAHLFPDDADLWRRRAREAARSRLYGGIHFPMDNEVGMEMGAEIGLRAVDHAREAAGG
jgi:hypothetical protein